MDYNDLHRIMALRTSYYERLSYVLPNLQAMATHTVKMLSWRPFRPICGTWTAMLGSLSRRITTSVSFWTISCTTMKEECPQAQTWMRMQSHKVDPCSHSIPTWQTVVIFLHSTP